MKDKYGVMKTFSRGLSSGLEGSGKDLLNDVKIDQVHTGLGEQGIVNMTRQRHWHLTLEGICDLNEYRKCVCVCGGGACTLACVYVCCQRLSS